MNLTKRHKALIALLCVLGLFIITNPSASAFKEHLGHPTTAGLVRENNFFIFSVYKNLQDGSEYNGVLENFIQVKEKLQRNSTIEDSSSMDSSKHHVVSKWDKYKVN